MTHTGVLYCPLLRSAVMDIYFIIEIAVCMACCAGTLTTEEWKAEQQLFAEAVSVNSRDISQIHHLGEIAISNERRV